MNSKTLIAVVSAIAIAGVGVGAAHRYITDDTRARVLEVTPWTQTVQVPYEECREEVIIEYHRRKGDTAAGAITGAVIGGVLGHQVGKGSGRKAATAAGAAAGAITGSKVQEGMREPEAFPRSETQCITLMREEQHEAGFKVRYRFKEEERTVVLDHDPGRRLRVDEDGRPFDDS